MPNTIKNKPRSPLSISSFGQQDREQFGQRVRLALGCIEAPPEPVKGKAIPDNLDAIRQRLKVLSQEMSSQHADLLVHEGGYTIQRVDNDNHRTHVYTLKGEQFVQQQHIDDLSMFEFESMLRSSKESFDAVRKLSPTQYRFRITDAQGNDILDRPNALVPEVNNWPTDRSHCSHPTSGSTRSSRPTHDSTRISCEEPASDYLCRENNKICAQLMTFEPRLKYYYKPYYEYSIG